jgi:hypothetical protein
MDADGAANDQIAHENAVESAPPTGIFRRSQAIGENSRYRRQWAALPKNFGADYASIPVPWQLTPPARVGRARQDCRAKDEAIIHKHAEISGFPAFKVTEIIGMIDPTTATG